MTRPRATAPGRPLSSARAVAALLFAATLAAFLPLLGAGFINLDDPTYVTENAHVRDGWSAAAARWALTGFAAANWHPLTWASHLTDVWLFGLRPAGHHATSLALHALAAALLALALARLTGRVWPGALAAALFALHPLRVESVAWVAERKDVLAGLLGAATLLLYARHVRRPSPRRLAAVTAAFALGLMAKPTLVTLPLLLLLLDWWPLGRLRAGSTAPRARLILEKAPLFALSAASCVVTYLAQARRGAVVRAEVFPLGDRALNALASYGAYLGKTLWPAALAPFYPHRGAGLAPATALLLAALLAGIGAAAWTLRRRCPWLLCGWLWFLGALVPMIGLVQVGLQGMADRYTYLPSIGLALASSWALLPPAAGGGRAGAARAAAAAVIVAALASITARQCAYWKDTNTLFGRAVQVDSGNYLAYHQLGLEALLRGDEARAVPLLSRAVAERPEYLVGRYNLGLALAAAGRNEEALGHISAFLRASPGDAPARMARAVVLGALGRHGEALADLDAALVLAPEDPRAHFLRGRALGALGRAADAAEAYRRAAALDPRAAEIRLALAGELQRLGRTREALGECEAAVRLDPGDAAAREALAQLRALAAGARPPAPRDGR